MHLLSWNLRMRTTATWWGYLAYAFGILPIVFRARFGRWPFVVPAPLSPYTAVETSYGAVLVAYSASLMYGASGSSVSRALGYGLLVAAVVGQTWAVLAMGESWRIGFDPMGDRTRVVRRGPYRLVKHPIYWSLLAIALSQLLLLGVDWRTLMLVASTALYFAIQAATENRIWHAGQGRSK
jgi:protein-S-isoprenylcysteine O-methyltransferase Ste14